MIHRIDYYVFRCCVSIQVAPSMVGFSVGIPLRYAIWCWFCIYVEQIQSQEHFWILVYHKGKKVLKYCAFFYQLLAQHCHMNIQNQRFLLQLFEILKSSDVAENSLVLSKYLDSKRKQKHAYNSLSILIDEGIDARHLLTLTDTYLRAVRLKTLRNLFLLNKTLIGMDKSRQYVFLSKRCGQ